MHTAAGLAHKLVLALLLLCYVLPLRLLPLLVLPLVVALLLRLRCQVLQHPAIN